MKANELRIGNILLDDEGNICTVRAINSDRFETFKGQDYHGVATVYIEKYNGTIGKWLNKLSGIPLTIEWLDKFGFLKTPDNGSGRKIALITVYEQEKGFCIWLHTGKFGIDLIEVHLENVHELQNLYFYLTGEELLNQ